MKSKYIISGCLALASLMPLTSCSDFLTEDPQGTITPEGFYKTSDDLTLATNGLLYLLQTYQCNTNPCLIDCMGDDITSTTGSNKAAYLSADAFEAPTDEKGIIGTWNNMYKIIKAANDLVNYSDNATSATEEERNIAKGQGYFWRAVAYLQLVRYFGQCPLVLENAPETDQTLPSIEDIYNQIILDLEAADKLNLPAKYTKAPQALGGANVFASAQAVKSVLAAANMHMAGYPLYKTERYAEAAKYAKQVIDGVNNGTYDQGIVPWENVYNYGDNYNNGIILGIFYQAKSGGWSNSDSQWTSCHQIGALGGWGDFLAERRFWANFPAGPRKDNVYAQQIYLRDDENGNPITVDWWATTDQQPYNGTNGVDGTNNCAPEYRPMFIGFSVNKVGNAPAAAPFDYTLPTWTGMCLNKTHQLIRYSEVLCWYAEAVARSNGSDLTGARAALKLVRQNAYAAGDPAIAAVDALSGDALADAAFKEHGWEVAGNSRGLVTRRHDQFRMNILKENWEYRRGNQTDILVPAGTLTHGVDADGNPTTYVLQNDVRVKEPYPMASTWVDNKSVYNNYPNTETQKNPNLVR